MAAFRPNLIRSVAPANAAIVLIASRKGWPEASRSVCPSKSTPDSSHKSTQCQNARGSENGNAPIPSPIRIAMPHDTFARGVDRFRTMPRVPRWKPIPRSSNRS